MKWYISAFKKYATFSGRARRKEYWMFLLINCLVVISVAVLESAFWEAMGSRNETGIATTLVYLGSIVPTVSCLVRRMHDTDHSGWWIFFPLVNTIFALLAGTPGLNRFGPDPKAEGEAESASTASA